MKTVDVRQLDMLPGLDVLLVELVCEAFLTSAMEKGTNVGLIAAGTITLNALVLVRMVESFHCRVTLVTFEAALAVVPPKPVLKSLAVLWCVLEQVGRSTEITCVVRVDTTLGVVAVFLRWTPTSLIEEHVKYVSLLSLINLIQLLV